MPQLNKGGAIKPMLAGKIRKIPSAARNSMEVVEIHLHTFLFSAHDTVERSTAKRMDVVDVKPHTSLISEPENAERSYTHRMDSVAVKIHII